MDRKTKVDIIVEVLGEKDPEIQRLVALDNKVRAFAEKAKDETQDDGSLMGVEVVAEWAMLQDKYYKLALERKQMTN